jgi:hypothetical protein
MEWKEWEGKNVFLRTKHDKVYSGKVLSVGGSPSLIFIHIIDKFGNAVSLIHSEIVEIKEEDYE